jgi:hypothetical protein
VLHAAAYWPMLAVRDAIPKIQDLTKGEFTTLRLRLHKIAALIIEIKSRICVAFATACAEAEVRRYSCNVADRDRRGSVPRRTSDSSTSNPRHRAKTISGA